MKYISLLLFAGLLQIQVFGQFSYGGGLSLNRYLNTQGVQNGNLYMPGLHATSKSLEVAT